ncbi:insoluble domain protein [Rhodococcus opacus]|uniref:insoluble domain protein n=1 Tax=Rhodococcus opacus TaxID=37919 RepID=UPI001F59873A|nr:insoluble domain protein [Rhodococcus opacus]UNN05249.1 insoluble domain protein [Rhodococcus opacus]
MRAAGTTAVTAAVIVTACGGIAHAEPSQGGVTTAPSTQSGVTTPAPSTQGGVTTAPAPEPEPVQTWVPVPVEYQQPAKPLDNWDYNSNEYVVPTYDQGSYVEPIDYSQLHLPTQLEEFTAPIQAPEDKVRWGRYLGDRPNWMSKDTADRTNGQTAVIEAQVTDFWRSTGLKTEEAERLAAAQVAGGAAGAVGGALAAGVPVAAVGAVTGGLVGGTIGGTSAVVLAAPVLTPLGVIPAGVVGTAAGTGIGAGIGALAGVPAAVGGAIVGGAIGVAAATAYGAGEVGAPTEVEIPDIDQPAITAQTETTLDQWEASAPVGSAAADAVRGVVEAAPIVDQQARDAVSSLPGGEQAVAAFDQAVTDFQANTAVPGLPMGMITDAIGAGIPA